MAKKKPAKRNDGTVGNLRDLAKMCGVTEAKMKSYRSIEGFPQRNDRRYDAEEVLNWIAAGCPAPDDEPGTTHALSDIEPEQAAEVLAAAAADDELVEPETAGLDPGEIDWITVRIPVAKPDAYIARQTDFSAPAVQCRLRDEDQIRGMQYLHAGCRDAHVQLENGKHVDTRPEVFRWLFGLIGQAIGGDSATKQTA